jgi:hypothetical protein
MTISDNLRSCDKVDSTIFYILFLDDGKMGWIKLLAIINSTADAVKGLFISFCSIQKHSDRDVQETNCQI